MNHNWPKNPRVAVIGLLTSLSLLVVASGCEAPVQGNPAIGPSGGHYTWGAEVNVFSPCGSDQEYWVDATPELVMALRDRYMAFDLPPYSTVFVSLYGEVGPVLDCGFCEAYDGSFKVTEVVEMESPGPEYCVTEMGGAGK